MAILKTPRFNSRGVPNMASEESFKALQQAIEAQGLYSRSDVEWELAGFIIQQHFGTMYHLGLWETLTVSGFFVAGCWAAASIAYYLYPPTLVTAPILAYLLHGRPSAFAGFFVWSNPCGLSYDYVEAISRSLDGFNQLY